MRSLSSWRATWRASSLPSKWPQRVVTQRSTSGPSANKIKINISNQNQLDDQWSILLWIKAGIVLLHRKMINQTHTYVDTVFLLFWGRWWTTIPTCCRSWSMTQRPSAWFRVSWRESLLVSFKEWKRSTAFTSRPRSKSHISTVIFHILLSHCRSVSHHTTPSLARTVSSKSVLLGSRTRGPDSRWNWTRPPVLCGSTQASSSPRWTGSKQESQTGPRKRGRRYDGSNFIF